MISIHAPREGGDDYSQETKTDILGISIHPPREGGDVEGSKLWFNCNPISIHAPREGGDAAESTAKKLGLIFQSTPPARGATWVDRRWKDAIEFQSTPPARGATGRGTTFTAYAVISIHAPREGATQYQICP